MINHAAFFTSTTFMPIHFLPAYLFAGAARLSPHPVGGGLKRATQGWQLLMLPWWLSATGTIAQGWTTQTSAVSINAVKMLNGTTGWAVGNTGTIVKTTNGGTTWTTQTSGTGQTLYSTRLVGGAGYVVGGVGTILYASAADLALPVTLRYFSGRMTEAGALLGWQTATETNNACFSIERSRDRNRTGVPADQGLGFESIGSVPS